MLRPSVEKMESDLESFGREAMSAERHRVMALIQHWDQQYPEEVFDGPAGSAIRHVLALLLLDVQKGKCAP